MIDYATVSWMNLCPVQQAMEGPSFPFLVFLEIEWVELLVRISIESGMRVHAGLGTSIISTVIFHGDEGLTSKFLSLLGVKLTFIVSPLLTKASNSSSSALGLL
jgi:hypothetical protein